MGVLNVTPDSFSDGGKYCELELAVDHALEMVSQGAKIIDVGGESTRPNAAMVSTLQELDRVIPVIEKLSQATDVMISIDTSNPEVMRAAVSNGASLINDVRALQQPYALQTAAELNVPVCLMHMQGTPQTMQNNPQYQDVVSEVKCFLQQRIEACLECGIAKSNILIDPGFGFGKTLEHNLILLNQLQALNNMGYPLLVGLSRKSMIDKVLRLSTDQRIYGSIALAVLAAYKGASIIRTHDVQATLQALSITQAVLAENLHE